jgi:phosphoribosylformylglycinamidine cyclo-ligase
VDRGTWTRPPVFDLVGRLGPVAEPELERTLNVGVGMVAVVPDGPGAVRLLADRGVPAWVAGEITAGTGTATLVGTHRR